jgi:Sugar phosphate isomerases/epimerases
MKFVGHTMALPGVDIVNAIKVFSGMKLDGIEIVAQEGTPFHLGLPDQGIFEIIEASNRYNLPVITLTPYLWNINSADHSERKNNIDGLIRTIHLAEKMGAQYVRAYGGTDSLLTQNSRTSHPGY